MALAMHYPEPEKGGRGKKRVEDSSSVFSAKRLQQARQIAAVVGVDASTVCPDLAVANAVLHLQHSPSKLPKKEKLRPPRDPS